MHQEIRVDVLGCIKSLTQTMCFHLLKIRIYFYIKTGSTYKKSAIRQSQLRHRRGLIIDR